MKKIICFVLVLLVLPACLTACNFTQKVSGALESQAEATPKVEAMMIALAYGNTSDAKALLHPQVAEKSDNAIAQMSNYLAGRNTSTIELKNININTSNGTSGKIRKEQVAYQVTLTDNDVIFLNAVYLSNEQGTGFISFQVVMGVV